MVPSWSAADGPRERIVAAACELFLRLGIRAVGVDAIMDAAGVARGTFYRYFPGKADLVVAFVERTDLEWRRWFTTAVTASGSTAHEQLLGVFGVLPAWFASPTFRGSPFLNAAAEVGGSQARVAELAREHTAHVHAFLAGLAGQAGSADPAATACQVQVLLNGAVATAQLEPELPARLAAASHAAAVAGLLLAGLTAPGGDSPGAPPNADRLVAGQRPRPELAAKA